VEHGVPEERWNDASTEYDEYCVNMLHPEGNEFDVQ
jgi:hypothetical protein